MHSSALTWTCTYTHRASAMKSLVCCAAGTWDWWKRSWESFSTHNGLYSKFQPSHCLFQNTDSASREHTNSCRREWGRRYSPPWCRGYLPPPHASSCSQSKNKHLQTSQGSLLATTATLALAGWGPCTSRTRGPGGPSLPFGFSDAG